MILPFLAACVAFAPHLSVNNIEAGETVRTPMVILRGETAGTDLIAGVSWQNMTRFPVANNKFIAVVELKPGANFVLLNSARETVRFRLDYKPMTSPYKVRTTYLVPADETSDYEAPKGTSTTQYGEKLDTVMKVLQAYAAEAMHDAGFERKAYNLEFDKAGKVVVNVVRSPLKGEELRKMDGNALWSHFYGVLEPKFPMDVNKCCAVMSFTRYDQETKTAKAHTALGGGGLALFGGGAMRLWPASLKELPVALRNARVLDKAKEFDDSGNRGTVWGMVATTLGAMQHEMGHTFGLPHTTDGRCFMSRGFDQVNRGLIMVEPPAKGKTEGVPVTPENATHWDPFFASRLNWHPWFQPDGNRGQRFSTLFAVTIEASKDSDEIIIKAPYGLRVAGAEHDDKPSTFQMFKDDAPKTLKLSKKALIEAVGSPEIQIYAMDNQGNEARLTVSG